MTDRYVMIRVSTDKGHNWSSWRYIHLGEVGDFKQNIVATRFGSSNDFRFHIRVASPIKADLIAASVDSDRLG